MEQKRIKTIVGKLIISALAVLLAIAMFAGCGPTESGNPSENGKPPKITEGDICIGMNITKMPAKTEYVHGEKFNPAGLVFDAVYENGFDGDKNLNASDLDGWSPRGQLTSEVTEITLKFEGFIKTIPIKVAAKKLKGIEVIREPDINAYSVGDKLDLTGFAIAADYEEGRVENEIGYTVTDENGKAYAQDTVLEEEVRDLKLTAALTVGEVTETADFTVSVNTLIKAQAEDFLEVGQTVPTDKSYTVVTGKKASEIFSSGGVHTGTGMMGNITKGVGIDFYVYSPTAIRNVEAVLVASSTRLDNANKTMMDCQFNKSYKAFVGEGSDEEEIYIGNDVIVKGKPFPSADSGSNKWTGWSDVSLGNIELKAGFNKVSVRCVGGEKDADGKFDRAPNIDRLDIRVSENPDAPARGDKCTDIIIKSMPDKLSYESGEKFTADGIVFDAVYENGFAGDKNLTASRLTWEPSGPLTTADTSVTINFKGVKKTIDITVSKKTLTAVEITSPPITTAYTKGGALNLEGLVVKAVYLEGEDPDAKNYVVKDADGNVCADGSVLNTPGVATFTVSVTVEGVTKFATFTVNVLNSIVVQAEAILAGGEGMPEDRSYTVISGTHKVKVEEGNGATSVSDIQMGNKIDFYVYSKTAAENVRLILTAASLDRGSGKTKDVQFNKLFALTVDGESVSVGDETVIAGRSAADGERIWFLWTDNAIANVDLQAGFTKISIKCIGTVKDSADGTQRAANIDKIQIDF